MEHLTVRVSGAAFHVVRIGEGRPLVLLHGWPEFWATWEPVMQRLAGRFALVAPDLRGFGASAAPVGRYEKDALARDVVGLMDVLGVERWIQVGHDWGGFVAWLIALQEPARVERLVALSIIDPWYRMERSPLALARYWYQVPIVTPGVNRLFAPLAPRIMARIGAAPFSDEDARIYGAPYQDTAHVRAAAALYRTFALSEIGRWSHLRAEVPVTVATGTEDPVITPERITGAQADDLRVEVLQGAGHFIPEERPDEVADLILHR